MKILLWCVFAVLALLWTGGAVLLAGLTESALSAARELPPGAVLTDQPLPAWLQRWIDPALLALIQEAVRWAVDAVREHMPWLSAAVGWIVAAIWITWGLGVVLLLALFALLHWTLKVALTPAPEPAPPAR